MRIKNLVLISTLLSAATFSNPTFSQTCKVKTGCQDNGISIYTEVFEFDYVDEKPEFPGGGSNLISFINATREYPHEAYDAGIQGRVTCSFIVNPDGKISNIRVLRGVESSLNREAVRIVSKMPDWNPGKLNDHPVPVRVVCSIPFRK